MNDMDGCESVRLFGNLDPNDPLPDYPSMEMPTTFSNMRAGPPVVFTPNSRRFPAPPTQGPLSVFSPMINGCSFRGLRWVLLDPAPRTPRHAVLVFSDGAAPDNGGPDARAGCGVVVRPDGKCAVSFPLERVGNAPLTSNRAELRAAQVALRLRVWVGEGFGKIVVATDSEYVVKGVNEWVVRWRANGWKNSAGRPIANKDLWLMLLSAIEKLEADGMVVQFYLIQRKFNLADRLAKKGAVSFYLPFSNNTIASDCAAPCRRKRKFLPGG